MIISARRTGFYASNSAGGGCGSTTISVVDWPPERKGWDGGFCRRWQPLGTFAAHLDLRKTREMYYIRGVLEGSAARLAAVVAHQGRIGEVERQLRSHKTGAGADVAAIPEAGQRLHRLIVEECGNQVPAETIRSLPDHFVRFRHVSLQLSEKVLSSHREHLLIVAALQRRDGEVAEGRVREHFEHAVRFLMESLINRPELGGNVRVTLPTAL